MKNKNLIKLSDSRLELGMKYLNRCEDIHWPDQYGKVMSEAFGVLNQAAIYASLISKAEKKKEQYFKIASAVEPYCDDWCKFSPTKFENFAESMLDQLESE